MPRSASAGVELGEKFCHAMEGRRISEDDSNLRLDSVFDAFFMLHSLEYFRDPSAIWNGAIGKPFELVLKRM